ncbi:NADH-quinone oxidoreductase subunit NuoF [Bdellovibrio sp. SKB1291214]|uniref:NADH-quinone oxidoreductase subunit NuoF n=1 Tax=Bdellovibrio sp. SKB1291214 TaxID=1732569 RepID=UPI000B51A7D8|nr:NADH-quinone oxidoreductase subunit NuoF [Bdellovibrio sp. SKB1291214]UYL08856.1 NADH-quinone oxidoreductase subunit NuoF [Bdellovibrio sp. SKB1291214]
MAESKVLTEFYHLPEYQTLAGYKAKGGYETLPKALKMQPQQIIDEVKASGLRGRGGAGFPTGMKWGFLPKNGEPRYLLCNADEGEPGTFKDRMMMERAPHQLIEGMIISAFAVGSHKGYIYVRGEYVFPIECLNKAIKEAYDAGLLGKNILGSGFDFDLDVYRGAGAYICGEETGMISSLEGLKGQPKLKPPFPAVQGYLRKPTIVNNVETLAAVTYIVKDGAQTYRKFGTEKSAGTKLFSVSGNVVKPGNYEVPLGYPLIDLINNECGGMKPGRKLKAIIPGGSSAPVLTAEEVMKANLDYESLAGLGTMLGSGAVIVMDDSQCMVDMLGVLTHFYAHESCGQCTPCREGTGWLNKILHSILEGRGRLQDIDLLVKVADNMKGKTICALSDAAALPVLSFVTKFRDEFEFYVREGRSKVKGTTYAEMHH